MFDEALLSRLLDRALQRGGEFADVFCERRRTLSYRLQDGRIHDASYGVTLGVGIRVVVGESAGYAYSDDLSDRGTDAGRRRGIADRAHRAGNGDAGSADLRCATVAVVLRLRAFGRRSMPRDTSLCWNAPMRTARRYDPRVVAVNAHVDDECKRFGSRRAKVGSCTIADRSLRSASRSSRATRKSAARDTSATADERRSRTSIARRRRCSPPTPRASRRSIVGALPAPAGEMEMIVGAGGGGVLLHEAVGHGLESDFNRRGTSLYSGRVGERVASDLVTIYDDGNLGRRTRQPQRRRRGRARPAQGAGRERRAARLHAGPAQRAIDGRRIDGQRAAAVVSICSAAAHVQHVHAQRRRELRRDRRVDAARNLTRSRSPADRSRSSKGDFVFMVGEGYLVENGKITAPVRNATIVGNGPDAMMKVVAVGNDSRLARRHYTCGKGGQYVPVGVGMPTVKISSITVGGTQHE